MLSADQVIAICWACEKGKETYAEIGQHHDISPNHVCNIYAGKRYPGVERPVRTGRNQRNAKFPDDVVAKILKAHEEGKSYTEIARVFPYSKANISLIVNRKSRRKAGDPPPTPPGRLHGENHPSTGEGHSDAWVVALREAAARGDKSDAQVARDFGTSVANASLIILGRRRRDAGGPIRPEPKPQIKLSEADRAEIRRLHAEEGWGYPRLAEKYGVSTTLIRQVDRRKTKRDLKPRRWEDLVQFGGGRQVFVLGEAIDELSEADVELLRYLRGKGEDGVDGPALKHDLGADAAKRFHRLRNRPGKLGSVLFPPEKPGQKGKETNIRDQNYRIGFPISE